MLSVCEGEEVFFDSVDESKEEEEEEEEEYDWMVRRRRSDYDIWLSEPPQSVNKRREMFLSGMGFVESELETSTHESSVVDALALSERRESNSEANSSSWGEFVVVAIDENPNREMKKTKSKKKKSSWWRRKVNNFLWKKIDCEELSGKCRAGQQLKAHNGLIRVMKFSPDGQYLGSGGADGVVCVWRVVVVGPGKVLHIEEEAVHKFRGHSSDVLDLAWSTTNHLLSSSMDTTVCLWQAGSDECLGVFHHSNYVTCVQFNPVEESCSFISGSIDGKVRIWGIEKRRVKDWANVGDIVTAVCYQPDGKGFVVGSVSGHCRLYEMSGDDLLLNADINIQGKRKSSGNRITGIQFLKNDSRRVMITTEDSKIRILDGLQEVVCKYKGLTKSGCQMSASFTSSGRHIVSVGEDSRIYLWNYEDTSNCIQTSKQAPKSTRSCDTFFSAGVSVAIPWSHPDMGPNAPCNDHRHRDDHDDDDDRDSERFSLANWFSMDRGTSRASTTWPEEKLPVSDCNAAACGDRKNKRIASATGGLVFVTANWDGTIRTFHNYGLSSRI